MTTQPPSFVTQVQRPEPKNTNDRNATAQNQNKHDDDQSTGGCCSCFGLFGKKKAPKKNLPANNNNTNNPTNNNNNDNNAEKPVGQPVNKLAIPNIVTQVDRDQVGINSPRANDLRRPSVATQATISLLPPQKPGREGRKCLVLDLDETLVHSSFQPVDRYDFLIPVEIDGNTYQVYVAKRPHVDEFLKEMGKVYEVVIFTASLSKYADPVLDLLDKHKVIDFRLFREHCTYINDIYVKDMSIMGRPIESVFIIDNSPHAYSLQPENAVPCISWFDDYEDNELLTFIPVLTKIADPSVKNIVHELERLKMNGCGQLKDSFSEFSTDATTSEDSSDRK